MADNTNRKNIFSRLPQEPDYNTEVEKIREWMYEDVRASIYDCLGTTSVIEDINTHFMSWPYRGTTSSLEELLTRYGVPINQRRLPKIDKETFLDFCEIILNLCAFTLVKNKEEISHGYLGKIYELIVEQISAAATGLNYAIRRLTDGRVVLVVPDVIADCIAAEEPNIAERIVLYRHQSMQGDISGKKDIILAISQHIEPLLRDRELGQLMKPIFSDVGYALNNMNIRHNNVEGPNARKGISTINPKAYESLLDNLFTLMLMVLQGKNLLKIHNEFAAVKKMTN